MYTPVSQRGGTTPPEATPPVAPTGGASYTPVQSRGGSAGTVPMYTPVSQRQATPPPEAKPGIFSRIGGAIGKAFLAPGQAIVDATQEPDPRSPEAQSVWKQLPSAIMGNLPIIGPAIQAIRDDPETAATVTGKDLLREVPGAVGETAKGLVKAPIAGLLDVPNFLTGGYADKQININVPGLGEVTNSEYNIAQRIANGEEPLPAVLSEKSIGLLNIIFLGSLGKSAVSPRPVTLGKSTLPAKGVYATEGAKTGRIFDPNAKVVPTNDTVVQALASKYGVTLPKSYDPSLPTFFRKANTPGGGTSIEMVQLRPSYVDKFISLFGGKIGNVPESGLVVLGRAPAPKAAPTVPTVPAIRPSAPVVPETPPTSVVPAKYTPVEARGTPPVKPTAIVPATPAQPVLPPTEARIASTVAPMGAGESQPVNTEPQTFTVTVGGQEINVTYTPQGATPAHFAFQTEGPNPVSNTGYRSEFMGMGSEADVLGGMTPQEAAQKLGEALAKSERPPATKKGPLPTKPVKIETTKAVPEGSLPKPTQAVVAEGRKFTSARTKQNAGEYYDKFGKTDAGRRFIRDGKNIDNEIAQVRAGKKVIASAENEKYRLYITTFKGGILNAPKIFVENKKTGQMASEMFWMKDKEDAFNLTDEQWDLLPESEQAKREAQYKIDQFYKDDRSFKDALNDDNFNRALAAIEGGPTQAAQVKSAVADGPKSIKEVASKPTLPTSKGARILSIKPELKSPNTTSLRPPQLVNKTDLREALETLPGKKASFTVVQKGNGRMTMRTTTPKGSMFLRPSALGLVEKNLANGDFIEVSAKDLKAPGTAMRAMDEDGNVMASTSGAPIDAFENRKLPETIGKADDHFQAVKVNDTEYVVFNNKTQKDLSKEISFEEAKAMVDKLMGPSQKRYQVFYHRPDKVYLLEDTQTGNIIDNFKYRDYLQEKADKLNVEEPKTLPSVGSGASASAGNAKIDSFENRIGEAGKANDSDFKLYKKVDELIKKYAVRVGEGYLPRGAAGVFYHDTENIRLTGMNQLSVAAHEVTHRLDLLNGISKQLMKVVGQSKDGKPIYEGATAKFRKELTKMYETNYAGAKHTHPLKKRMVEGYATLLQKYVEAPVSTGQNFPVLVSQMLQPGGQFYHPVIGEIIADLTNIVEDYQALEPLDKVGARVTSDLNPTGKESFLSGEEMVRTEIADEIYPIEKLANEAGVGMTLKDPSLWMRQYNSVSSLFANNVVGKRGYWSYANGGFHKVHDFNWGSLNKDLQKAQTFDQFNHFLVARDQHFNFLELNRLHKAAQEAAALVKSMGVEEARIAISTKTGKSVMDEFLEARKAYQEQRDIMENNGFNAEVVRDAYETNKDRFAKEAEMYDTLIKEDLRLLNHADVGLLSDEHFKNLTSKQGYASLKRQFYDEIVGDESSRSGGTPAKKPSSLKARTGSTRTIVAPVLSGIKNHAEILRKSLRQIVDNKIVGIALAGKHPDLFQRQQLIRVPDKNTGMMLYPQERDPNIIMGRINGTRVPFLVDGFIKKTVDEVLDFKSVGLFEKLLQGSSRFFTKGTTGLFPGFTATNFTIDQITAVAQTQHGYVPVYSAMKELYKVIQDSNSPEARYFQEYMVMGGERQTMVGWQELSARELAAKIAHERTGLLRIIDVANSGADILAAPQKYSEIITRAVEYVKSRQAGDPQIVALEKAGRITAPFHHVGRLGGGRFGKTLVRSIPFFNPGIQVLEQAYRTGFRGGPKARARMLFTMLAVTAATIASFGLLNSTGTQKQKDNYKDKSPKELANYMWFPDPTDDSNLIKLRMPNILNWAGSIINMALADQLMDTKYSAGDYVDAGTSFLPTQMNIFNPSEALFSWIPQLVKPSLLTAGNVKDFPHVMPLESQSQQRKEPGQRSTPATPALTKWMGQQFNISPIKLDYLINGYFGRVTGFVTGKPGILNPLNTLNSPYYFESGRRLQEYYDRKAANDQKYNTLLHSRGTLSSAEAQEVRRERAKLAAIGTLLDAYGNIDVEKYPQRGDSLRTQILAKIEAL